MFRRPFCMLVFVCAGLIMSGAHAKTFLTMDEALASVYPDAEVVRTTVYLTDAQQRHIEKVAGSRLTSSIVHPYEVRRNGERVAVVFFDAHRVRTLPQTLMVALDAQGVVEAVRVLVFAEPEEYLAPSGWIAQFTGKALTDELQLERGIDGITGATLTARATTQGVRRLAAVFQEVYPSAP